MELIGNIVLILLVALIIAFLLLRFKIPALAGFLIAGAVIGPHGLGLIHDIDSVRQIAEVGIILLLFTIGIEFAPARLLRIRQELLIGGGLQVLLTSIFIAFVLYAIDFNLRVSAFSGFVLSLSSTAIVLKILSDKGETTSVHGKLAIGVLLFQDIAVIPAMIILNITELSTSNLLKKGLLPLATLIVLYFLTYYIGRLILGTVARTMYRELFTIAVIVLGLGIPLFASFAGASYSLGAFIVGLGLASCEYSHQVESEIMPFRDVFNSLFFISMGMLIDAEFIYKNLSLVFLFALALVLSKFIIGMISLRIISGSFRSIFLAGVSLANIGEFSLVLLAMGFEKEIISREFYQILLAISSVTLLIAPFMITLSERIVFPLQRYFKEFETRVDFDEVGSFYNHVIICGYGLNGQNLARVLKSVGLKYVVLEINPATVRTAKLSGEPIFYGDVTRSEILLKAGITSAKMVVIAISDPVATRRAVWICRSLNNKVYILVRTRFVSEVEELYKLGANSVIPEEFETSIEIFAHVLKEYRIPDNVINQQIQLIRLRDYEMLRRPSAMPDRRTEIDKILLATLTDSIYIEKDYYSVGKSIEKLNVRKESGASVIAIVRKGKAVTNPPVDFVIEAEDVVILIGSHAELDRARRLLISGIT